MRTLIIGAGAVGGYFGARLTAAGRDVTFLVRERRKAQLEQTGLNVTSPHGNFSVKPKLLLTGEISEHFDLIILSTKAYQLTAAMDDFAAAVGPQTAILPLLNGMAHLDLLANRFGEQAVLGGSTRIVADVDADGTVHSLEPLHDVVFGERDKAVTPRIQAIATELANAGFDDKLSPDIIAFMWQKWVFLAALGAITTMLRGSIGEIQSVPYGEETQRAILDECANIARANGYPTPRDFLSAITKRLTLPGSVLTASMYRDMMRNGQVEADHILGDLLSRGRTHAVDTPLLQAAYVQLGVYQRKLPQS